MEENVWEAAMGSRTARLAIADGKVIVASNCGPDGADVGAVVSHQEFLEGRYQDVVRKVFGQALLDEMIAKVRIAAARAPRTAEAD